MNTMSRVKQTARKSTGGAPRRPTLLASKRPREEEEEEDNRAYKWVYVMVRLINVAGKLRCAMTATAIRNWLGAHPDVYNLFNYVNLSRAEPHILVGVQARDGARVDVYLLVGMMLTVDTVAAYSGVVAQEIDAYMARPNMTLGVTQAHCMYIAEDYHGENEDPAFAGWCATIIKDCADWAESGDVLM